MNSSDFVKDSNGCQADDRLSGRRYRFIINVEVAVDIAEEDTCLLAGLLLADGLLPADPTSCCFATSSFSRRPVLPASSSRIRCKVCFGKKEYNVCCRNSKYEL